nr:hypothetical protein Iba_chr02cCG17040 [Ipomoea batatas]GME12650.1 hypothetical protein Iba_scaffold14043CG0090 [Ipomoea batatas]
MRDLGEKMMYDMGPNIVVYVVYPSIVAIKSDEQRNPVSVKPGIIPFHDTMEVCLHVHDDVKNLKEHKEVCGTLEHEHTIHGKGQELKSGGDGQQHCSALGFIPVMAKNKESPEHGSLSQPIQRPNNPIIERSSHSCQSKHNCNIPNHKAHGLPRVLNPAMLRNGCSNIRQLKWGWCPRVKKLIPIPIDNIDTLPLFFLFLPN